MKQGYNAVYFGAATGDVFQVDKGIAEFSEPQIKNEVVFSDWAPWGSDNRMPIDWAEKLRKCGVLSAAIEAKARIAIGKGIAPVFLTGIDPKSGAELFEFMYDDEIHGWMEENHSFMNSINQIRNVLGYGWTHSRFIMDNNGEKIARWKADDVSNCRLKRKNKETGCIENSYIAADWYQIPNTEGVGNFLKVIELLEEGDELSDLQDRLEANTSTKEFSVISRGSLNGQQYYPYPLWYSAYSWVDFDIKVPAMKVAMMNNQISVKYVITISELYFSQGDDKWDEYTAEQKQEKFNGKAAEINKHLSGNEKQYKSIVTTDYTDPASGKQLPHIKIEPIDDKVKDGKLLVDASASDKQILFSLMFNPAIFGANLMGDGASGGAGSGSDIREAYLVQILLMETERQMNNKIFNIVKNINGWSKKYPGKNLQFRYPNSVLTTLDTGVSSAPTA